jgi:hypothetical protein
MSESGKVRYVEGMRGKKGARGERERQKKKKGEKKGRIKEKRKKEILTMKESSSHIVSSKYWR